uniref:Reverse transcriptase domain-containing protein n=1 Tax=Meloidogyne enterolobii TaxID=390850 RepID=A0A6V7X0H5_MELEN|nr:unnamed protein product [Meloidogyne enterolobii]
MLICNELKPRLVFSDSIGGCEILIVKISSFNIFCIYRPPNIGISHTKLLFKTLTSKTDKNSIICGDFNFSNKDVIWTNSIPLPKSATGELFVSFFNKNCLKLHTTSPTRGHSWLDLVMSNCKDSITNCQTSDSILSSDHAAICFDLCINKPKTKQPMIFCRKYDKPNTRLLNIYLSSILPSTSTSNYTIEDKYNSFISNILTARDQFLPGTYISKFTPRYPASLKASIKEKARLWKIISKGKSDLIPRYNSLNLHVKIQIRKFYAKLEKNYIEKDPLNIFKYINRHSKNNNTIPSLLVDGDYVYDDKHKCEIFAGSFFLDSDTNFIIPELININPKFIDDIEIDSSKLLKLLNSLPNKEGLSPDFISYRFLKNCSVSLVSYISELFRISLDSAILPNIWKESVIIPLFKKGNKELVSNYRPISITCSLCRVMERFIFNGILEFLLENNIISPHQFGFLPRRSTTTQLITTLEDWFDGIFSNKNIDCIYLDLRKAFDSIPHDLLLYKLHKIGVRGKIYNWIKEFLTNRKYRVKINDSFSSYYSAPLGVPQGSVLGPLLFLIYINDLPDIIPKGISVKLFADDIKIYLIHDSISQCNILSDTISNIELWCGQWGISISSDKSYALYLGRNNQMHQYKIEDTIIKGLDSIRDLGIIIDNKLSFHKHFDTIVRTAYYRMKVLFKTIRSRSIRTWTLVYKSYIRPILEYAPEIWNPHFKKDVLQIEKCQKFFTSIALKKYLCLNVDLQKMLIPL